VSISEEKARFDNLRLNDRIFGLVTYLRIFGCQEYSTCMSRFKVISFWTRITVLVITLVTSTKFKSKSRAPSRKFRKHTFSALMATRRSNTWSACSESSRKRRPSLKVKLNAQSPSTTRKKCAKHKCSQLPVSSSSDEASGDKSVIKVTATPCMLTPPPKAPDIPYFMMARIMIDAECIYRDTVETKVYLFSANGFLHHADSAIAR